MDRKLECEAGAECPSCLRCGRWSIGRGWAVDLRKPSSPRVYTNTIPCPISGGVNRTFVVVLGEDVGPEVAETEWEEAEKTALAEVKRVEKVVRQRGARRALKGKVDSEIAAEILKIQVRPPRAFKVYKITTTDYMLLQGAHPSMAAEAAATLKVQGVTGALPAQIGRRVGEAMQRGAEFGRPLQQTEIAPSAEIARWGRSLPPCGVSARVVGGGPMRIEMGDGKGPPIETFSKALGLEEEATPEDTMAAWRAVLLLRTKLEQKETLASRLFSWSMEASTIMEKERVPFGQALEKAKKGLSVRSKAVSEQYLNGKLRLYLHQTERLFRLGPTNRYSGYTLIEFPDCASPRCTTGFSKLLKLWKHNVVRT